MPRSALSDPVVQALVWEGSASSGEPDEEGVRLEVMQEMERMRPRVLGPANVWLRIGLTQSGEQARASGREDVDRRAWIVARLETDIPGKQERPVFELFESTLTGTRAGIEELFNLFAIEVPVLIKGDQDRSVSREEVSNDV
jgi:hypothetical protein